MTNMLNGVIASTYLHRDKTNPPPLLTNMLNLMLASTYLHKGSKESTTRHDKIATTYLHNIIRDAVMMMMMMMMMMMTMTMMMTMAMTMTMATMDDDLIIRGHMYIYISKVHRHGTLKICNPSTIPARNNVRVAANMFFSQQTWRNR